jgi:hypothetical protein
MVCTHLPGARANLPPCSSNKGPCLVPQELFPQLNLSQPGLHANWPDPEVYHRACEKRGAVKRQQEEDFPARYPLRVTAGRAKV